MNEAAIASGFRAAFLEKFPKVFYYKIPDGPFGGVRPFDSFAILNGHIFCIEFKSGRGRLKKHQAYFLKKAEANGAIVMVINRANMLPALESIESLVKMKEKERL